MMKFRRFFKCKFFSKQDGIAAIEYAILLPIIIALSVGGIDLALYMLKQNAAERLLNVATIAIQSDQTIALAEVEQQGTSSLINFPVDGFLCARSFINAEQANSFSELCGSGVWIIGPPNVSGDTYYVGIRVSINYRPVVLRGVLPEQFTRTAVVPVRPGGVPPVCDGDDEFLQSNGDGDFVCTSKEEEEMTLEWYGSQGRIGPASTPNAGCASNSDHAVCPSGARVVGVDLCNTPPCPFSLCTAVLCEIPD